MPTEAKRRARATVRQSSPAGSGYALGVLFAVSLFNYIDRSLISILQVPIKAELGLSDAELGALTGLSFALFYATAALPLARLVDRYRRTFIMAAALAAWTVMTAMSGFAMSFAVLVLCRIGVALGEAGSVPATHSLLSDYFPLERRGTAFAVWALASPVGVMLGVLAGGWLGASLGWRHSFVVIGALGLLLVPLLLSLPEPVRGAHDGAARGSTPIEPAGMGAALRALWHVPSFKLLVVGTTLQTFSYSALLNWMPPFYARVHELPMAEVALWSACIIGIGGGAGAFLGGALVDFLARRDRRWYGWAPAIAILGSVPFALVQLLAGDVTLSIGFGFVAVFLAAFFVAPVNATAQSMVPPTMRGLTSAVLLLVPTIFGVGLGPFVTGAVSDMLASSAAIGSDSLRYAIGLALIPSLGAAAVLFTLGRNITSHPTLRTI